MIADTRGDRPQRRRPDDSATADAKAQRAIQRRLEVLEQFRAVETVDGALNELRGREER